MTASQKWLLVAIMLVAVFFRFYQITNMPGGLFPDEAANGLDVNLMQQGHLQPFYERGNGREALFFYMEWASMEMFGRGVWQFHVVSAFIGVLATLLCFLVARQLFSINDPADRQVRWRATNVALLAAFLMAASSWHVVLSRTALRANLIPLVAALTFFFLLRTYSAATLRARLLWSALTGAAFALGFYTYIAYRMMAPIMLVLLLWPWLAQGFTAGIKRYWKLVAALMIGFIIVIFPIAKYFYTHAGSFVGRSGQVSIFNPDLNHGHLAATFVDVTKKSILAYFTHGDLNWRHNISGFPFLSPVVSPFFALGLILVTFFALRYVLRPKRFASDWKHFLLALWFWAMLLPVVTTAEGIPHGLRSIGTIPAVFIITSFGIYRFVFVILTIIGLRHRETTPWKVRLIEGALIAVVPVFAATIILQTYFAYFVYAANSPENFYFFRSDLTPVSQYLNANGHKNNTYLVLDKYSVQTMEYLTTFDARHPADVRNQPYIQVDPEDSWKLPRLKHGDQIVFCQSSIFDTTKFQKYHPEARLQKNVADQFNQTIMLVYVVK